MNWRSREHLIDEVFILRNHLRRREEKILELEREIDQYVTHIEDLAAKLEAAIEQKESPYE